MLVAPTEPKEPPWKRPHPSGTSSTEKETDLIYRFRPTEKDREKKLRNAQSEWDPASVSDWMHWIINQRTEAEGKPTIQWLDTEND